MNISQKSKGISKDSPKVFVGLSGGVDSAVSAVLLKRAGYDVTGVFIKGWQPDFLPCTWREERRDAMRVAITLGIPFLFFDFEDEYKRGVVDEMLKEYKAGRTPNPDVLCNREVKFGAFWKRAKELGAHYIATGHYILRTPLSTTKGSPQYVMKEGKDREKDQSYFLWTLTQDDLSHTLFPVGDLKKSEVRRLAEKFNLSVAEKKDSQGLCFLGELNMDEFLSHFIEAKPGKVLDTAGKIIGTHKGALLYTVGARHGFEVMTKGPDEGAFYVVAKDVGANTITVSNKKEEIESFSPKRIVVRSANWVTEPTKAEISARIRYRGEKVPVALGLERKRLAVKFKTPQRGVSLGQSMVFYDGEICLGGAVMDEVLV